MARSFGLVEDKVYETDFFLEKLKETENRFEASCYLSAFVSAARSITFALQASMSDVAGFSEWYQNKQESMRHNTLAKFFVTARNESQKLGIYHIDSGVSYREIDGTRRTKFFFRNLSRKIDNPREHTIKHDLTEDVQEEEDIATLCERYLTMLVELIYDCFKTFGPIIDPAQYYTPENLNRIGKSIEDVEVELGFPRGWTKSIPDEERTRLLRESEPDSYIDDILIKYLKKDRFGRTHDI